MRDTRLPIRATSALVASVLSAGLFGSSLAIPTAFAEELAAASSSHAENTTSAEKDVTDSSTVATEAAQPETPSPETISTTADIPPTSSSDEQPMLGKHRSAQPNVTPFVTPVDKYPETGSDEWNALSDSERVAASDDFYGMDPTFKQYFEPRVENSNSQPITYQMWRRDPLTGKMTRIPVTGMSSYITPGEKIYFFIKMSADNFPMKEGMRLGWGFQYLGSHKVSEGVWQLDREEGTNKLQYTFLKPDIVMVDGQITDRFDDAERIYGTHSTSAYPAPNRNEPYQGHKIIESHVAKGTTHYVTFEYTMPKDFWYASWSHGSGSNGQAGGSMGASAQGVRFFPLTYIDVRYVLDSDYRTSQGIDKPESEQPLTEREYLSRYQIIDSLESKQLSEKSQAFNDGPGHVLFPLDTTFKISGPNGSVVTMPYKYVMCGYDAFVRERPTFESLIKDIPGYRYVANDFEFGQNAYYHGGEKSRLPKFDYEYDSTTGRASIFKHFYVTYEKLPEPPAPPTPPEEPPTPPSTPPEEPPMPPTPPTTPPSPPRTPEIPQTSDTSITTAGIGMIGGLAVLISKGLSLMPRFRKQ